MSNYAKANEKLSHVFLDFNSSFNENSTIENTTGYDLLLPTWWKFLDDKYLRQSYWWAMGLIAANVFNLSVGMIGNLVVILVIVLSPQLKSVKNTLIMNLAAADLLFVVFCGAGYLQSHLFTTIKYRSVMCQSLVYGQSVSLYASAYSLAAISFNRCRAICQSYGRSRGLSKYQCRLTVFVIWMTATIVSIPWAQVCSISTIKDDNISYCTENWTNENIGKIYFVTTKFLMGFCLPFLIISISNLVIWFYVNYRKVPRDSDSTGSIQRMHLEARHGVFKTLGVITLVFLLSWLPFYVLAMRLKFGKNISDSEYSLYGFLIPIAQWLCTCTSVINPILHAFLNKKFREVLQSWIPFVNQNRQKYITRDNVRFRISLRSTRTSSNCSVRSSKKSNRSSGKTSIEGQSSLKYTTKVVYIPNFKHEKDDMVIVELSSSPVKTVKDGPPAKTISQTTYV